MCKEGTNKMGFRVRMDPYDSFRKASEIRLKKAGYIVIFMPMVHCYSWNRIVPKPSYIPCQKFFLIIECDVTLFGGIPIVWLMLRPNIQLLSAERTYEPNRSVLLTQIFMFLVCNKKESNSPLILHLYFLN